MKIACLTFTFPRDYEMARRHAITLPPEWQKIWCVESKDETSARAAAPAGTQILVADFPRGESLRRNAAVHGMRRVFQKIIASGFDGIVKLDSDTALFRPRAWSAPLEFAGTDFTYISRWEKESRLLANGCAYTLSARAVSRLSDKLFYPAGIPNQFKGHEDLIFSAWLTAFQRDLTTCRLDKNRVHWKCKAYNGKDILAAHYGYIREIAAQDFQKKLALIRNAAET